MKWIKRIIGFIKLYKDYEYEPETWRHIVETYQIDKWYDYHDKYECGREYVSNYGKCPICTDCPDNCPLEKGS